MKPYRIAILLAAFAVLAACSGTVEGPRLDFLDEARDGFQDIVYIGTDGNIYTVDASGENTVAVTQESPNEVALTPNFSLPTWSPDGRKIAFMGFAAEQVAEDDTELRSTLYVADAAQENIATAFSSIDTSPFYLYWAPDSERVTFASSYNDSDIGLSLQIVGADGSEHSYLVSGRPMYWAWAPDSGRIIAHAGSGAAGRISLVEPGRRGDGEERLSPTPTSFQAPQYSPDGSLIAAVVEGPGGDTQLVTFPAAGAPAQPIATMKGEAAFGWSPDGSRIAYIDGRTERLGGIRGQLHVIAPEPIPSTASQSGTGTRIPAGEEVIAFFWSPDGSKLAFFKPLPSTGRDQRIVMTLFVYDTERREVRNYGTFPAASTFAYQVLPHFDQYQRSATIWSPDSSQLVLSGMEDRETPAIYVVDLAGGEPVKVAEGHMAFWRPGVEDDVKVSYSSKTMWSDSTPR